MLGDLESLLIWDKCDGYVAIHGGREGQAITKSPDGRTVEPTVLVAVGQRDSPSDMNVACGDVRVLGDIASAQYSVNRAAPGLLDRRGVEGGRRWNVDEES